MRPTDDNDYWMPVEIIRWASDFEVGNRLLNKPILNIFQAVYDDTSFPDNLKAANTPVADQVSNKIKIRKIKPHPPTDNDIIDFFRNSFPDPYLVNFHLR